MRFRLGPAWLDRAGHSAARPSTSSLCVAWRGRARQGKVITFRVASPGWSRRGRSPQRVAAHCPAWPGWSRRRKARFAIIVFQRWATLCTSVRSTASLGSAGHGSARQGFRFSSAWLGMTERGNARLGTTRQGKVFMAGQRTTEPDGAGRGLASRGVAGQVTAEQRKARVLWAPGDSVCHRMAEQRLGSAAQR